MPDQPRAAHPVVGEHRLVSAHRCTCGWEGDSAITHVIDVLNALPVEQRMEAMGMERVGSMDDMGHVWMAPKEGAERLNIYADKAETTEFVRG